jgi:von Willebrand factor type A domain/Aerotolerance regulator N-terminal
VGDFVFGGISGAAAAGIGIAAALILTGLYLLKRQRRRVEVPFAALWIPSGGAQRAERLARRLRRWLSLLLQLIFAALILIAIVDPRPAAVDRAGRTILILVDRSASMSARDEAGTRLARARGIARDLAAGLGAADRAMLATFAAGVSAETSFETEAARLVQASDRIAASEEPGDLGRALDFAAAVLRGRPHPTLILVSDGGFSADDRAGAGPRLAAGGALAGVDLRFAPVGQRADNLGILSFAARRYPADPSSVEAAVVVQSFRDRSSDVLLEITAGADGHPVERVRLHLDPHQRLRHPLAEVAAPEARLVARLIYGGNGAGDDLGADDRAYAVVPGLTRARVLRVGDPDLFLDGALLSLAGGVSVQRRAPQDLEATRATWDRYDAVIFDGVVPAPAPTRGHFIYLDPHGPASPFVERGGVPVRNPIVSDIHRAHPLLRHVSLVDLNIAEARRLELAPGDEPVAAALGTPLILARARGDLHIVALAFDVRRSDLPMRAAFPLLLANAIGWLGAPEIADASSLRTGRSARVVLPPGRASATVTDPTGATHLVAAQAGAIEIPIARAGFYRIVATPRSAGNAGATAGASSPPAVTLAANLGDPTESDTRPAPTLDLGGRVLAPPDPPVRRPRREIWWLALLAAALLTLGEWWTYHRRWTV